MAAARACGARAGNYGPSSYLYAVEYLGVRYAVSGVFTAADEGLLQLEAVAPEEASGFVTELAGAFVERNGARNPPPP